MRAVPVPSQTRQKAFAASELPVTAAAEFVGYFENSAHMQYWVAGHRSHSLAAPVYHAGSCLGSPTVALVERYPVLAGACLDRPGSYPVLAGTWLGLVRSCLVLPGNYPALVGSRLVLVEDYPVLAGTCPALVRSCPVLVES